MKNYYENLSNSNRCKECGMATYKEYESQHFKQCHVRHIEMQFDCKSMRHPCPGFVNYKAD